MWCGCGLSIQQLAKSVGTLGPNSSYSRICYQQLIIVQLPRYLPCQIFTMLADQLLLLLAKDKSGLLVNNVLEPSKDIRRVARLMLVVVTRPSCDLYPKELVG